MMPTRSKRRKQTQFRLRQVILLTSLIFLFLLCGLLATGSYQYDAWVVPLVTVLLIAVGIYVFTWIGINLFRLLKQAYNKRRAQLEHYIIISFDKLTGRLQTRSNLVIDRPKLHNTFLRALETIISLTVWSIFIYFLQYIATVLMWGFGLRLLHQKVFDYSSDFDSTLTMLENISYFAIIMFIILYSWAQWNYWRFGRLNRRKFKSPVTNAEMAEYYSVPLKTVCKAQSAKIASVVVTNTGLKIVESQLPAINTDTKTA